MHNFKYENRKLNLERAGGGIAPFLLAAICIYDHMRKEKVMTHLLNCEQSQRQRDGRGFRDATEGPSELGSKVKDLLPSETENQAQSP